MISVKLNYIQRHTEEIFFAKDSTLFCDNEYDGNLVTFYRKKVIFFLSLNCTTLTNLLASIVLIS